MLKRILRSTIAYGLRNRRVRRVVEAELADHPVPVMAMDTTGQVFADRHGTKHPLDRGLRDRLKPGWRAMLDPAGSTRLPSMEAQRDRARRAADTVREANQVVASLTGKELTGRLLEIGCYDGAVAYQLARNAKVQVVASDLARYYVVQQTGQPGSGDLQTAHTTLSARRERARVAAGIETGVVQFVEDDITVSSLEPMSFDAIVSFEVLEHVASPGAALAAMARLLVPGGVAYHDYNPFFSNIGGHSLCTLDMPWGHARLESTDFERYLAEIRPSEADQALRFYQENLNRFSLADLRLAVSLAGLDLLALLPWVDRALLQDLTPQILSEAQRAYPAVTIEDLLATMVTVVVRKP